MGSGSDSESMVGSGWVGYQGSGLLKDGLRSVTFWAGYMAGC